MIKIQNKQVIDVDDWDELVKDTYGRVYNFQQQSGCQERGNTSITIPDNEDDFENDTIPDEINGDEMGVSFKAWLTRDPHEWNGEPTLYDPTNIFWERNFYPSLQSVANDLHAKGLIPSGDYVIEIDW